MPSFPALSSLWAHKHAQNYVTWHLRPAVKFQTISAALKTFFSKHRPRTPKITNREYMPDRRTSQRMLRLADDFLLIFQMLRILDRIACRPARLNSPIHIRSRWFSVSCNDSNLYIVSFRQTCGHERNPCWQLRKQLRRLLSKL